MHGPNTKPRPLPLCLHNKPPTAHYFAPKNISASSSQLTIKKTNNEKEWKRPAGLISFHTLGIPELKPCLRTKTQRVEVFMALKTHLRVSSLNSVAEKKKLKKKKILVHNL